MAAQDTTKLEVKLFAEGQPTVDANLLIEVLQRVIQKDALPGLLIDVVDYSHVPNGPGVALIGHETHYYLDRAEGRLGLLCSRRRGTPGTFEERLADAFRSALRAAKVLGEEPQLKGKLRFVGGEARVRLNDRRLAPSNEETFAAVKPAFEQVLTRLYGAGNFELAPRYGAGELFTVAVRAQGAPELATLLARL